MGLHFPRKPILLLLLLFLLILPVAAEEIETSEPSEPTEQTTEATEVPETTETVSEPSEETSPADEPVTSGYFGLGRAFAWEFSGGVLTISGSGFLTLPEGSSLP